MYILFATRTCKLLLTMLLFAVALSLVASCDNGTPAGGTPVPTDIAPALDGQIDTGKLYHDSRDAFYRSPGGAVAGGTVVTLRLKTAPDDLTSA